MNEQLQNALALILQKAVTGVEEGVSFLSAELPDVAHQLLMWNMVHSILLSVLGVLVFIPSYYIFKYLNRVSSEARKAYLDGEEWTRYVSGGKLTSFEYDIKVSIAPRAVVISSTTILSCFLLNLTWLKILIAPKLYLIEYATTLVK